DRNLGDAAYLVLNRIFDRDDLVFVCLDLVYRGVQSRGLATAGRSRDQHHAVRLGDVAAEFAQVFFIKSDDVQCELVEFFAHRFFVKDAEHRIFAVDRRHDGNTEVDRALGIAVLHAETSVLWNTALGDVQLTHHLDTRDDRG